MTQHSLQSVQKPQCITQHCYKFKATIPAILTTASTDHITASSLYADTHWVTQLIEDLSISLLSTPLEGICMCFAL